MSKTIKILSIDGGGTRGLFPATLLECLEKETGKKIPELFDVIVGSATGGIIATALAAGMDAKDIADVYLHRAKYILPRTWFRGIWNVLNIFAPKYRNTNLKALLEAKFGATKTLGQVDAKLLAKNGKAPVFLFPTLELNPKLPDGQMKAFKVVVFNNREAQYAEEPLVDVALKTSAAIMNLPIYDGFVEGGNYANDPALVGLFYALGKPENGGLGADLADVKILSLGCGSDEKSFISDKEIGKGNWGMARWVNHLAPMVIETKMVATQYYLNQVFAKDQYLRINVNYKSPNAPRALRREKKLAIDVREDNLLRAISEYAHLTYQAEHQNIKNFIGQV